MAGKRLFAVAIFHRQSSILAARLRRVRQFHHIIEITCCLIAADVKERKLAGMFAGDTFKSLDARELTLERLGVLKCMPPDNLCGAQGAGGLIAGEPHFAIRTATNPTEQIVIGNDRNSYRAGLRGWCRR